MFDFAESPSLNGNATITGPHAERLRHCFQTLEVILTSDEKRPSAPTPMHMRFPSFVDVLIGGDPVEGHDALITNPDAIGFLREAARKVLAKDFACARELLRKAEPHAFIAPAP